MNTAYDKVVYPNRCQAQTHPDRLGVIARLFGVAAAPAEHCRVLEIGCGDGGNLLPLAWSHPESRFVGFDLAESRVLAGRESVTNLGVSNLELDCCDILDFPLNGEPFDYIIAHGVYSWIPAAPRDRLLAICRARLAPRGVAYISYNCLPGCHLRRMVRDIMRFHTRMIEEPVERVRQAVAVCEFVANSIEKPDTYRQIFKEQLEQIQKYRTAHLFHDDLAEVNDPVYFHEFAAHAARHDLQYLGEADFFDMQDDGFSEEARQTLAQMQDSRLTREQYLDFVKCRRFRQTLLCHREISLCYPADPSPIEGFHISSQAEGNSLQPGPDGRAIVRFATARSEALEIGHSLGIHAVQLLAQEWPATISFDELFQAASAGETSADALPTVSRSQLRRILLEAYRAGVVEFRLTPVRCTPRPSDRPVVSRFVREQLARSDAVTTLRGENLVIADDAGKRLLELLDGTRTWAELERLLPEDSPEATGDKEDKTIRFAKRLQELARLALLEA